MNFEYRSMSLVIRHSLFVILFCIVTVSGQSNTREPTICDVAVVPNGLTFQLKAEKDVMQSGFADNLIVEAFREFVVKRKDGKLTNQKRRNSIGIFPAIPVEIVQ